MNRTQGYLLAVVGLATLTLSLVLGMPRTGQTATRSGPPCNLQPFTSEICVTIPAGSHGATGTPFSVPGGKLLVVESISVNGSADAGTSQGMFFTLHTTLEGAVHNHNVVMTKQGSFIPGWDSFVSGQMMRVYADSETEVNATVYRNGINTQPASAVVTVTGYLVDKP